MTTLDNKIQQFVNSHSRGTFFQTKSWGEIKSLHDWTYEQIIIEEQDEIQASCTVLFRKIPHLPYTIAYAPRGYVGNYEDEQLTKKVITKIKEIAKKRKAIVFYIEPNLIRDEVPQFTKTLLDSGFKHAGRSKDDYFQTRYESIIYFNKDEDDTREYLTPRVKKLLTKAEKSPLEIVYGKEEDIKHFTKLSDETANRNGIRLRNNDYYEAIFSQFSKTNDIDLLLVKLNKEQFLIDSKNWIKEINREVKGINKKLAGQKDIEKKPLWQEKLKFLENRIASIEEDINKVTSSSEDIYLSGCLIIYSGKESYYVYAASASDFRYLEPNVLMNYTAMQNAKNRGCTSYNLLGFHEIGDNLHKFKSSLGGEAVEYEGLFTLVLNRPLFFLFNLAKNIRK